MKKDKLDIIYQDKHILVVNKPHNLLTMSTDNEKEKTLFHKVYLYEKQKHKNNKIFIIHRLDRDTSGLVIFAKSEEVKNKLQNNWDKLVKHRGYIAIVEGSLKKNEDTIKSYLHERKDFTSYSSGDKSGKLAITKYKKLASNKSFSLVDVEILTGRKNQIRVHMSDIGNPVTGDKKYGSKLNPLKRLGLHAYKLHIIHPVTNKEIVFESKIPKQFLDMFPKINERMK